MLNAEGPGHAPGDVALIVFGALEGNSESLDTGARYFAHQRRDRARIDATGKECSDRHVASHVQLNRFSQHAPQVSGGFLAIDAIRLCAQNRHTPVALRLARDNALPP